MFEFWQRRQRRKRLREALHHARLIRNMRCDLLLPPDLERIDRVILETQAALRDALILSNNAAVEARIESLSESLAPAVPARRFAGFRENFEVLLVAIAVAMAFRAYFFQPFKIPTGSMQPTLYGIHSVDRSLPGFWDRMPFKPIKWLVTGSWHRRIVIRSDGNLRVASFSERPGYVTLAAAGSTYHIPADAFQQRQSLRLPQDRLQPDNSLRVHAGDLVWAGDIISGDHVFVNRMRWNFRRPRRGEVMVFSTDGIPDLQSGTHYIKRLSGLPGESISIDPPDLRVDGLPVRDVPQIARIAKKQKLAPWAQPYDGYQLVSQRPPDLQYPSPLLRSQSVIRLADDEYLGLGDNTGNSLDSRYFGPVPEKNLVGPSAWVYWPFLSPRWGRMR